jgi:hypothetical protein
MKPEQILMAAVIGLILCKLLSSEGYKKEKFQSCGCGA